MRFARAALCTASLGLAACPAMADGYPAVPLLSASKSVMGEDIAYPTSGPAIVDAAIVTIGPGEKTIIHQHGVPLFVYILEGEVTVDYEGHGTRVYKAGDSFLEAMHVEHHAMNLAQAPVRMIAVYMGAQGSKDVIPKP